MRGNIGIPALVVLLAASGATRTLSAQQAPTAPAPKSSAAVVQQAPVRAPQPVPKDPVAARLANANPAPAPTKPAPAAPAGPATPAAVQPAPPNPAPAVLPASAAEKPAAPPPDIPTLKVTCGDNQLTITANNTTLGNVLNEVRRCSGAQIDAPGNAYGTRIYDNLGPGPTREVLEALLGNSGFDYVIGASDTTPGKIDSILLMTRNAEPGKDSTGTVSSNDPQSASPMRRAFAERREASRPHTPEEQAQAAAALANAETPTPGTDAAPVTENAPATAGNSAATNGPPNTAPNETQNPAQPGSPQTPASSPDTAAPAVPPPANDNPARDSHPPSSEEQIMNMEQLFQQRQKMMQQPQTPPKPQ